MFKEPTISKKYMQGVTAIVLAGSVGVFGMTGANASPETQGASQVPAGSAATKTYETKRLTEAELKELGLTKEDAQQVEKAASHAIDEAETNKTISSSEAKSLRDSLLNTGESHSGNTTTYVLPVWAAGAIVGCAGSVALGEGKAQIKNALKDGKSVDEATDILIGAGVDCVFGAVPGGAIGAVAKKALTTPIKNALRPALKKVVEKVYKGEN